MDQAGCGVLSTTENNNDTNDKHKEEIITIAAHHDGDKFTDEDLKDIEKFKEYVRARNSK